MNFKSPKFGLQISMIWTSNLQNLSFKSPKFENDSWKETVLNFIAAEDKFMHCTATIKGTLLKYFIKLPSTFIKDC